MRRLLSVIFGRQNHLSDTQIRKERAIQSERARMNQSVQAVASGSRVMQNMAGMMRLMAINDRIDGDAE
jgi:hypothetical protein